MAIASGGMFGIIHPEKLEQRPELPPPVLTKKQYKEKMKAERKQAKEERKTQH